MASTRPWTRVSYWASLKFRGVSLVAVKTGTGDTQILGKAALHLGHIAGPGLAGAVIVDQHAVHLVVPADALTPIHALLDTHGVGGLVVGADHLVHIVVHEAESGGHTPRR